jgi:hypothetical protein
MTLAKAKARANETFIEQALLMIVTYNRQNILIVHANDCHLQSSPTIVTYDHHLRSSLMTVT